LHSRIAGFLVVCASLAGAAEPTYAANLTVEPGVVVKFGTGAGLEIRDLTTMRPDVVLTSLGDDSVGGQTQSTPGTPAAGDWLGVSVSPAVPVDQLQLSSTTIRYAGAGGNAGLSLEFRNYPLNGLLLANNLIGVLVRGGGSPLFNNASFLANAIGVVSENSSPQFGSSEFIGNVDYAIRNDTPATPVTAMGNWWGAANGPTDPVGNPTGSGDRVSTGVNYGSFAAQPALLDCRIVPVDGRYSVFVRQIQLALNCRNATQYRIAESASFAGASLAPMNSPVSFTLSPAAGNKTLYAEFRGTGGTVIVVSTAQPVVYTPSTPSVAFTAPAANAVVAGVVNLAVNVSEPAGLPIDRVEFYAGTAALGSDPSAPFTIDWDSDPFPNAPIRLRAVAFNSEGRSAEAYRDVYIQRPDLDPPVISNVRIGGVLMTDGMTITAPGSITATINDASVIRSTLTRVDGTSMGAGSLNGQQYSIPLNFVTIADGAHTIRLEATDHVNNVGSFERAVNVQIPVPPAPVISSPATAVSVQQPTLVVAGQTQAGSKVQLYRDNVAVGGLLTVTAAGNYSGSLPLVEGVNAVSADARNVRGVGPRSSSVNVTFVVPAPQVLITVPAEFAVVDGDTTISAAISNALPIASVRFLVNGQELATSTTPPWQTPWATAALAEGNYNVRVEATNTGGTVGSAERTVTIRHAPPPPPPFVAPYLASSVVATPAVSFGERDIVISGRVLDRDGIAVGNSSLAVLLRVAGFERRVTVVANATGDFQYNFVPQASDSGRFSVAVVHPDETVVPELTAFTINRLSTTQNTLAVNAARNFVQPFSVVVHAGPGDGSNGVRIVALAEDQPSGSLPAGISLITPDPVNLAANTSQTLQLGLTGDATAAETGSLILALLANDSTNVRRASIRVDFHLFPAEPALVPVPASLRTGVRQGQSVTEVLRIENRGLVAATNVRLALLNSAGTAPAPAWAYLATVAGLGTLAVGAQEGVQISASPTAEVSDGIYNLRLRVTADNATGGDVPVAIQVTQAGDGSVRFTAADIFTNTVDAQGNLIVGLANANIRLQSETNSTLTAQGITNASGQVVVGPIPAGRYTWRATGPSHTEATGRVLIRPATTIDERVFLDFDVVRVEWSVEETTIVDQYNITLTATFQTLVPAPVVLLEPLSINLPDMQLGEVITGEVTVTNYGLVRADNVVFTPPIGDAFYHIEFLGTLPNELAARQRVSLPYRITKLPGSLVAAAGDKAGFLHRLYDELAGSSLVTTSSCSVYSNRAKLEYDYACAAGDRRSGAAGLAFNRALGTICNGTSQPHVYGGRCTGNPAGCGDWGGYGGGGSAPTSPAAAGCRPDCGCSCGSGGGGGPGGGAGSGNGGGSNANGFGGSSQ
jgi:large repetitive protein